MSGEADDYKIHGAALSVTARPKGFSPGCDYFAQVEISGTKFEMQVGLALYESALAAIREGREYHFALSYEDWKEPPVPREI